MEVYIVVIKDFFKSDGVDYAMPVDLNQNSFVYPSPEKALNQLNNLSYYQKDVDDCTLVLDQPTLRIFSYNREPGRRRVMEIVKKHIID